MSSSVGHNSFVMAVGTAASRLTGQIRTILLAAAVGTTGMAANAYQAGSMIPQVIFTLISGGIFNAVLVPQIVRTLKEDDAEDRLNKLITFAIALLAGITIAMMLLTATTPAFTHLYANGGKDMLALTNAFALWCMPQIFFYGLYTVLGQILAAKNHFGMYAWSSVAANIVSCAGFTLFIVMFGKADKQPLSFWTTDKIMLTAGTWTLGVAVQALVLFLPLFKLGLRYRWRWGVHGIGLRSMGSVAAWSLGIVGIDQLLTIISTRITTNAPLRAHQLFGIDETLVAGNATYQNAFTIYILPYSLIAVSVATAVFPRVSRAVADNDLNTARDDLSDALRNVTLLMSFFSAIFVVLSVPISLALLPSISVGEAQLMSGPMIALSLSLPLSSSYLIIQRTFYAFEDGRSPFIFMAVQLSIQMLTLLITTKVLSPLDWTLMRGVAVTLAYALSFPLLVWMLRKRFENRLDGRRIALSYIKATAAAVAAAIVGLWLRGPVEHLLGAELTPSGGHMNWLQSVGVCVVIGIVVIAVYVGALWGMHTEELVTMLSSLKARVASRRSGNAANVDGDQPAGDTADESADSTDTTDTTDTTETADNRATSGEPDEPNDSDEPDEPDNPDNPDEPSNPGNRAPDRPRTGPQADSAEETAVPTAVSTTPVVRMTTTTSPASTRFSRYGAEGTMKPQLGDTVINRYTLVSLLRDEPGLQAWKANDRVLARDCQLYIVTDADAIAKVDAIASSLALSRNRRFTQVLQLQHRGDVSIIITAVDNGLSLTDYFHGPASGTLSHAAMRSILGETASAMRQLLVDGLSHYALNTDTIRLTANGVQLADATLSPMLADTSHAPEGLGAERLATRQLAAVLYALITRTPSSVDTQFDLSKLGPDVPGEFRLICHRGLESDGNGSVIPMESLAELTALLGDWEPLSHLQNSDIALPSIDAECSIANAALKTPDPGHILDFPQDLSSSFEQHSYAQAAQASVLRGASAAIPDAGSNNTDHAEALAARQQAIQQAMQQESAEWMKNSQAVPRNPNRQTIPHPEVTDSSDYDFHDIAAAEVANIMAPSVPDPDNAIFPNFNAASGPYTDTQATMRFDFARKAAKNAHRLQPPSVNESTSRIPVYDANGVPVPPGDESRRALENEQTRILAANTPVSRPPSFTPTVEPEKETHEDYNPVTQDDVADEKLFGRFSTKVVAIVVVIVVVAAAAGLALHSLSGGSTLGATKQSSAWPSQNLDKVPFGSSTPTSDASSSGSSGKSSKSGVITEDKDASAVPTPKVPENNTPYSIDKQEFLTKPGGQDGYGYYMHLSEPESVYRFVVSIRSSGGTGYLYANTTADPTQGEQVAQFSFDASGTTDVKLTKAVKSQDFLMWVPRDSLPGYQLYIKSVQLY